MRPIPRVILAISVSAATLGLSPVPALATTGPYTLPFFDPSLPLTQGYGCTDFDEEPVWDGTNADGTEYECPETQNGDDEWFHKGMDYDTDFEDVASTDAGKVMEWRHDIIGSSCGTAGAVGNYVIIKHDSTHFSIYYHLKHDSVIVRTDDQVSAGQKLAKSGNSGNSCGAHLHYELMTCKCSNSDEEQTYRPFGKWTTNPPRVPWLAELYSQSNGSDTCQGATVSHWARFKNIGGRTWKTTQDGNGNGRITLRSTDADGNSGVASALAAADWQDSIVVDTMDETTVPPDSTGYFDFGLKGNGTPENSYVVRFNLRAANLRWFDRSVHNFSKTVFILPPQPPEC